MPVLLVFFVELGKWSWKKFWILLQAYFYLFFIETDILVLLVYIMHHFLEPSFIFPQFSYLHLILFLDHLYIRHRQLLLLFVTNLLIKLPLAFQLFDNRTLASHYLGQLLYIFLQFSHISLEMGCTLFMAEWAGRWITSIRGRVLAVCCVCWIWI